MSRHSWPSEVLQSSALDCGPAALQSVLAGHGIQVNFERLRVACQTSVDGTSIDVLQAVAGQLGLVAQQRVLPPDTLLSPASGALPAIAITQLPDRRLHFVVLWRRLGPWLLVMDPALGRRLVRAEDLTRDLYVHTLSVPARAYSLLSSRPQPLAALTERLRGCGVRAAAARVQAAAASGDASRLAGLEAAARFLVVMKRARALGGGATALLDQLAGSDGQAPFAALPESFWSARPEATDSGARVSVRGAVLLCFSGEPTAAKGGALLSSQGLAARDLQGLHQSRRSALGSLLGFARADGLFRPAILLGCMLLAACGTLVEALLLRGVLELSQQLGVLQQRAAALAALCLFSVRVAGPRVPDRAHDRDARSAPRCPRAHGAAAQLGPAG